MKNLAFIILGFALGAWAMYLLWRRQLKRKSKCSCKKKKAPPVKQAPIDNGGEQPPIRTVETSLREFGINL